MSRRFGCQFRRILSPISAGYLPKSPRCSKIHLSSLNSHLPPPCTRRPTLLYLTLGIELGAINGCELPHSTIHNRRRREWRPCFVFLNPGVQPVLVLIVPVCPLFPRPPCVGDGNTEIDLAPRTQGLAVSQPNGGSN